MFSKFPGKKLHFLALKGTGIHFPALNCFPKLLTLDLWMDMDIVLSHQEAQVITALES